MRDGDEDEERKRQERERASMLFLDRVYGRPPSITFNGFQDVCGRRTRRIARLPLRLRSRVKAMVDHIMQRDRPPSLAVLFEAMLEAYLEKYGPIDLVLLPSNEEPGCSRIASSGSANARGKFREKGERKMGDDDEEAERKRQERERKSMSFVDRVIGRPRRITVNGFEDIRGKRRTGRIVQLPLRLHPRVKAMVDHIMARDQPPSLVVLFEEMVAAYLEKHGPIDPADLPSDEELIRRIEQERDKRDAE